MVEASKAQVREGLVAGDIVRLNVVGATSGTVVVLEAGAPEEETPSSRAEVGSASIGEGETGQLVDGVLGLVRSWE